MRVAVPPRHVHLFVHLFARGERLIARSLRVQCQWAAHSISKMFSTSNFFFFLFRSVFFIAWVKQFLFIKLITKLCQYTCTGDELVEADSLKLIFKIIASTCENHNKPWRSTATDALLTLTKSLNAKSMNYIHRMWFLIRFPNNLSFPEIFFHYKTDHWILFS